MKRYYVIIRSNGQIYCPNDEPAIFSTRKAAQERLTSNRMHIWPDKTKTFDSSFRDWKVKPCIINVGYLKRG